MTYPLRLPDGPVRLACLAAHPDDVEIGAGGFLLSLGADRPVSASFLTLTGTPAREDEARRAAEAFAPGAVCRFGRLTDGRLPGQWDAVKQTLHDFAADLPEPDIILAPHADDAHQDHRLVGGLARTVWRNALVLHYEIPKWDGDMQRPTHYVPVGVDAAERKADLLDECYPSQKAHDWWDRELFLGMMRVRGMECRSHYAEAFSIHKSILAW